MNLTSHMPACKAKVKCIKETQKCHKTLYRNTFEVYHEVYWVLFIAKLALRQYV